MDNRILAIPAAVGLAIAGLAGTTPAEAQVVDGITSAMQDYGLGQLVEAAKRADPASPVPGYIEHMLAGIALATNPTTAMEGIYPGSLAASAIDQLIELHGADIARMTYRDRAVFIGGIYSDPSIIPEDRAPPPPDRGAELCMRMLQPSEFRFCIALVDRIRQCSAVRNLSERAAVNCNEDLTRFYELMEFEGYTPLVREAGRVAGRELKTLGAWPPTSNRAGFQTGSVARAGFIACPRTAQQLVMEDRANPNAFAIGPQVAYVAGQIREGSDGTIPIRIAECKYRQPNGRTATVRVQWNARAGNFNPDDPAICDNSGWNSLGPWLSEYRFAHNDRSIYVTIDRLLEGNNRASDMFNQSERDAIARQMMLQAEPTAFPCGRPWER
jgi:hypothetical protein